ncbi:MAG: hypothetical protein IIA45_14040 [Bacteroidetes bacterium]|nr:hypothetical protein [Bacteroidota bacterium]
MKSILFLILTGLSINLIAQSQYNYFYDLETRTVNNLPIQYSPSQNVKEINFTVTKVKNGKTTKYIKLYNAEGKVTQYSKVDKNKNYVPIASLEYDEYGKVKTFRSYKNGRLSYVSNYNRTEKGLPLMQKKINRSDKIILKNTWTYNADGCLVGSIRYKRGGKVVKNSWVYEYLDNCKKSKSTLFNRRGKIINVWTFDCKDEGEKLEKKKNQTQICKWEATSDDFLTYTYRTFDEKGKIIKHVSKFTLVDTLIVEILFYDGKDQLIHKSSYDKDFNRPLKITYYKDHRIVTESVYKYKNELVILHSYSYKEKLQRRYEYQYNEGDMLSALRSFNKKGELYQTVSLDYMK